MTIHTNYALAEGVSTLPSDAGYLDRLTAYPQLGRVWVPDISKMTFSAGKIATIRDLTDSEDLAIAPDTIAPSFDAAGFDAIPSVRMTDGKRLEGSDNVSAEDAFTMFCICTFAASLGSASIACAVRSDAANAVTLGINSADLLRFTTGGSNTEFGAVTFGKVYALIGAISGTTRKFWVNGVRMPDEVMAAGSGATAPFTVGALEAGSSPGAMDGHLGPCGYVNADVIDDAEIVDIISGLAVAMGAEITA